MIKLLPLPQAASDSMLILESTAVAGATGDNADGPTLPPHLESQTPD